MNQKHEVQLQGLKPAGYLINVLGKNVWLKHKPCNPVVKFITKQEYDKHSNSIMKTYVVAECIEKANSEEKEIIYYIKKGGK